MNLTRILTGAVLTAILVLRFGGSAQGSTPSLIVIDPGHSGSTLLSIDPQFNMYDYEYSNGQENIDNWNVAVALQNKLLAAGYRVMMTKTGPNDTVSKRARINLANKNGAALFVFIHRDAYTFGSWGNVYAQFMDGWRENVNSNAVYLKNVCSNAANVCQQSLVIASALVNARKALEGPAISLATENYTTRGGYIPPGNLSILSLWATGPSILVEAGIPDTAAKVNTYAQGLFNGIAASIPVDPPPPLIRMRIEHGLGNPVRLAWPTAYFGCALQSAPTPSGPWTNSNLPVTIEETDFVEYDTIGLPQRFYRLFQ
jgi:N-acetylmuramoyl-L-alanine amidase